MTLAVKETIYEEDFQKVLEQTKDANLRILREKAFQYFMENGLPTPRNEDWKHTNVASLPISDYKLNITNSESAASGILEKFDYERNGFTALNLAFANFTLITIPKETTVADPIEFDFDAEETTANFPHILAFAESGCESTLIESYRSYGKSFTNSAIQIFVEEGAPLKRYRVQKESAEALHVGTMEVRLKRRSFYDSTNMNLGARVSRHDVHLKYSAEGGKELALELEKKGYDWVKTAAR